MNNIIMYKFSWGGNFAMLSSPCLTVGLKMKSSIISGQMFNSKVCESFQQHVKKNG